MIKEATLQDTKDAAHLALLLWPNHSMEDFVHEMAHSIVQPDGTVFLSYHASEAVGFASVQLRNDYVEGTSSSPVGYLEGLYVKEDYRRHGIARTLVNACENWAKEKGCREFASDCELENEESLATHLKLGFNEANRVICFTKDI